MSRTPRRVCWHQRYRQRNRYVRPNTVCVAQAVAHQPQRQIPKVAEWAPGHGVRDKRVRRRPAVELDHKAAARMYIESKIADNNEDYLWGNTDVAGAYVKRAGAWYSRLLP